MTFWEVKSRKIDIIILAETREEAFAKFFVYVARKAPKSLRLIGQLVTCYKEGESEMDAIPVVTIPILYKMGLIPEEIAIDNFKVLMEKNSQEAKQLLDLALETNKGIYECIEKERNNVRLSI